MTEEKCCRTCCKTLPLLAFGKIGKSHRTGEPKYRPDCKSCVAAEMRALLGTGRVKFDAQYEKSPHPKGLLRFAWVGGR